ncbi:uncharacterized protein LOC107405461 [Ziziphus jujuba]|uniref:Uncharacterized protein LOC107405461 n=1 Tax=Ziziphus jujuba TaxID=326968 RepID=A0ABM4AF08_ZIZJJ|nr:uncharacterized protein LOC107405461 [Ziziphus jujuba]XP_060675322.1 uncharacterized protein LOC107405461 [Ziziphus jujuba]XP_060675323.1 uncharacterized protein LOC107405461 [Ziziphus jujuba]
MSCIAEIGIAAIAEKIADCTVGAIGRQLGYIFQYKSNISNLKTETHNLGLEEQRMKELVDDATRKGHAIFEITKNWQKDAEEISKQAKEILEDENHANTGCCTFKGLLLLNLVPRYRLSKKAKKMCVSVVKIKGKVNCEKISYRPHLQNDFTNKDYINFDSRNETVDGILEALGDGKTRMIGVHGMPGAGKTTLVKEVSTRALEMKLFTEAVLVPVSNTPDVKNIQKAIAERLELQLDKETIPERALLLRNRLPQEKMLIILDDVWKELNLKDVGIVVDGDQIGCKILFTSRFERVLLTDMRVDKIFKVGLLEEAEALNWFRALVAQTVEKFSECEDLVNDIVEECARLPITIETIACALKDQRRYFWQAVLNQLKNSNLSDINSEVNEKVFKSIELCYNFVHKNEAKLLLLLCSLFEEDASIPIEALIRVGMGWGIFKQIHELQEARVQVHSLIDELKDRALLLDGDEHHTVKMHDIIRDVAISIARKSHIYCFADDSEIRCLETEALEKSKAIVSVDSSVAELLREGLEYEQLELILESEASQIPDKFFEITKNLRVLWLCSDERLIKLPSSLCSLGNLRALILRCQNVEGISLIGEIKNLEILDLSRCGIKELPREVGKLPFLRMLDLSGCAQLVIIQPEIISNLKSLEELYVVNSFEDWDGQGVNGDQRNASLDELKLLKRLTTLHLEIVDIKVLPKDLFRSIELKQYEISIGCRLTDSPIDYSSRCLELRLDENKLLDDYGLERLLVSTQRLSLNGLQGAHNVVYELDKDGFQDLKHFKLKNNRTIQFLVKSTEQIHPCSVFGSLETLQLDNLENLEKICDKELTKESFKRLRIIKVSGCNMLKNLLPFSMSKLEEIEINYCGMMEEIVSDHEEEEDMRKEVIGDFPQLRSLKLKNVPRLKSFCSKLKKIQRSEKGKQPMDVDNSVKTLLSGKLVFLPVLDELEVSKCHDLTRIWDDQILPSSASFHNLTKLLVEFCNSLEYLFSSAMATSFVQLKSLVIRDCQGMKEIVRNSENIVKMSFPKLNFLRIENLESLTTFSSEIDIDFPVLTKLCMEYCLEFSTFISKSEDEKLPSLFNEKVAFPSLKNLEITAMNKLKMIANNADVFHKLKELRIYQCDNVMKIFGSRTQRALASLRRLHIDRCAKVEEVFEIQASSFEEITHDRISAQLIHLSLSDLPNLRYVWGKDPQGNITFTHLEQVQVWSCPSLKSIFPFSIAKGLYKLRELNLTSCGIQQIVEAVGTTVSVPPEFVFPRLEEIVLDRLENLVCIYPGLHTSSWPSLTTLVVEKCKQVKVLALEFSCFQDKHVHHDHDNSQIPQVPLFFTKIDSFPNLKQLVLSECNLEKIWDGELLPKSRSFSKLTSLRVRGCGFLKTLLSGKLVFLPVLDELEVELEVSECHDLTRIWDDQILPSSASFHNLTKLLIELCNSLEYLFSSAMATSFVQLKSLEIRDCQGMKEIVRNSENIVKMSFPKLNFLRIYNLERLTTFSSEIDIDFPVLTELYMEHCPEFSTFISKSEDEKLPSLFNEKVAFSSLKNLKIGHMKKLKMISNNADVFQHLEEVEVVGCPCLKSIFPLSIAKGLSQFRKLSLYFCGIQQIVEAVGTNVSVPPEFVFPRLEEMILDHLENLVCIYPGLHTSSWPSLTTLVVEKCKQVKVLALEFSCFQDKHVHHDHDNSQIPQVPLFFTKIDSFPNLEKLKLSECNLEKIWDGELLPKSRSFSKLTSLHVRGCGFLKNLFSSAVAENFKQLQSLKIRDCMLIEEIMSKNGKVDKVEFTGLKLLKFINLPNLVSFSTEIFIEFPPLTEVSINRCPMFKSFVSKLKEKDCTTMTSLFHDKFVSFPKLKELNSYGCVFTKIWDDQFQLSSTSFRNLTKLIVVSCNFMKNLFSSAVAVSLEQLCSLDVRGCRMMEEIMTRNESMDKMSFPKLDLLRLSNLPNLVSFSSGIFIEFSVLDRLYINGCPAFETFISNREQNLYTGTMPSLFNEKVAFPSLYGVVIESMDKLRMIWQNDDEFSTASSFCKLKYLTVRNCENLMKIIPSSMQRRLHLVRREDSFELIRACKTQVCVE